MSEQARPLKGIQNRVETLGQPASQPVPATDEAVDWEAATDQAATRTLERRTVLNSLMASGWLNWEKIIWLIIIVLAVVTRLWDLAPRALHHDESIHGVFSYDMFKGRSIYRYDPTWHGPVLYYMVTLSYFLLGGANEFSLRFAPAMYGIAMIAICWALRPLLGRVGAIAFAIMMVVSPSVSYYARSLRHDIFATFGMLLFIIGFYRFAQAKAGSKGSVWWMAAAGGGFFILFGSHEMSFINLGITLFWLGIIFLLEIVALPAWTRRRSGGVIEGETVSERWARARKTIVRPTPTVISDDDELDEPDVIAEVQAENEAEPAQARLNGFEEIKPATPLEPTAEDELETAEAQPVEQEVYVDRLLGNPRRVWTVLFALFGIVTLLGSIHLFTDRTFDKQIIQFLGVNAYFIFIPFYLLLSAAIAYPLALLISYGYNRLSPRSNRIARIAALAVGVLLALVAVLLFLRGTSPTLYLTALGEKVSGTGSTATNYLVDEGFSGLNQITYGGLQWYSIIPELVVVIVAALLAGALVGWLIERRWLVYTEKGFYGFAFTAVFIALVASLISLRFIMVPDKTALPKVVLPLLGLIDKWLAYVIGGVLMGLIVGVVAGWFVSLAELIPDSQMRGSGITRAILKFARQPWSVIALLVAFGIPYILIFSNFGFTPERLADGFYRGIEYWGEQQGKRRLDEPWFYYPMLMLLYEIFAVVMFFIALVYFPLTWWRRSAQRGRLIFTPKGIFIGFTFWWAFCSLILYSIAGEKIPWLNMQIAVPVSLAAAAFLNDYSRQINWRRVFSPREGLLFAGLYIAMFAATLVLVGMAINFPKKGGLNAGLNTLNTDNDITTAVIQMVLVGFVGLALFGFSLWQWLRGSLTGRTARAVIMVVMGGLLFAYCIKSSIALNYGHPDTTVEPMIYTQTTPEVPLFVERLDRLSRDIRDTYKVVPLQPQPGELPNQYPDPANSKGIPLFVSDGVDWPLHWYLRDYTDVTYGKVSTDNATNPIDKITDARNNNYVMIMISRDQNSTAVQQQLAGLYTAETYHFRWSFPEFDSGYGGLGYTPPTDLREDRIAKKDISNTRWDLFLDSFIKQPFAGRLWRYIIYRELWIPPDSYDMVVYVRNDIYPDFGMTNATGNTSGQTGATGTTGSTNAPAYDLTASTTAGRGNGQYNTPRNIAVAPSGDTYVLDSLNGRVQHFDKDGKFLSSFGSIGAGDGQFSLQQYQSGPGGIALDDEGNIYVADTWGYRIEKFDKDGKFLLKWGQGQDVSSDPTKAQQFPTAFYGPRGIAFDKSSGELFITDTGNKRIVVYDKNGQFKRQFGSPGKGQGQFDEPDGIALGPDGNLYVADLHNLRVQVVDKQGAYQREIAVPSWKIAVLGEPYLAFAPNGDLYVSDPVNGAVLHYDKSGSLLSTINTSSGVTLENPVGLAFDADGNLYIADAKRNAIVKTKPQ